MLPDIHIERHLHFDVAREDLVRGGTKRRALLDYLPTLKSNHFIYAGSVYGSGGWALAEACRDLGFTCMLALSRCDYRPPWLEGIQCEIMWYDPQPVSQIHNSLKGSKTLLPLGFDEEGFKSCLMNVFRTLPLDPKEIWMPCVSGVMVQAARLAWPGKKINAVCTAKHHGDIGTSVKYQAKEKYYQPASDKPPYPANPYSDAKLWSFARQFALKDALIWNTSI